MPSAQEIRQQRKEEQRQRERTERRAQEARERAAELDRERQRDQGRRTRALQEARERAAEEDRAQVRHQAVLAGVRERRRQEVAEATRADAARAALRELHRGQRLTAAREERSRVEAKQRQREAHRATQAQAERDVRSREQAQAERAASGHDEARSQQRRAQRNEAYAAARQEQRAAERAQQRRVEERAEQRRADARADRMRALRINGGGTPSVVAGGTGPPTGPLSVTGPDIIDATGRRIVLRGVTLRGLERPAPLADTFRSPLSQSDLEELQRWKATAVLLPIAQDLALHGRGSAAPEAYLEVLDEAVERITASGLVAVVGLSVVSSEMPSHVAGGDRFDPALPDMESLDLWAALARRYRSNPHVLFDLFRAPHRPWTGDSTGRLLHRPGWALWRRWVLALSAAVRREHPAAIVLARGLDGGHDLSGFPLRHDTGTVVPRMVYAAEVPAEHGPEHLAALAALAARAPVCLMNWSPGYGEELQVAATGRRLAAGNVHWFASAWRSGSRALVVERPDGGLNPSPTGRATQRALVEPVGQVVDTGIGRRGVETVLPPTRPAHGTSLSPGQGAALERGRRDATEFEGVVLTRDAAQVAAALEDFAAGSIDGPESVERFVERFAASIEHRHRTVVVDGSTGVSDLYLSTIVDLERDRQILPLLRAAAPALKAKVSRMGQALDVFAAEMLRRLLRASESVELAERYGYDLQESWVLVERVVRNGGPPVTVTVPEARYSMGRNAAVRSLASGAGELATTLTALRGQIIAWHRATRWEPRLGAYVPDRAKQALIEPDIARLQAEYFLQRHRWEAAHPVLAAFAADLGRKRPPWSYYTSPIDAVLGELRTVAAAPSVAAARLLWETAASRRDSVARVRAEVTSGALDVFAIEVVAELVRRAIDASTNPLLARVLRDRINAARRSREARERLTLGLSVLAAALLALSVWLTGGVSLGLAGALIAGASTVGGVALSAWAAVRDVEDYVLGRALAGTDFDKAKALSQQDPSLFWLAVGIVGTVLDLADALKVVRVLAPTAKAAVALRRGDLAGANDYLDLLERRAFEQLNALSPIPGDPATAARQLREAAEREALRQRQGLSELADRWRDALNAETKRRLSRDDNLWQLYREMDPEVREVLTRCQSVCVPLKITPEQGRRLRLLLPAYTAHERVAMREFLAANRTRLDEAIRALERSWDAEVHRVMDDVFERWERGELPRSGQYLQISRRGDPRLVIDVGRPSAEVAGQFLDLERVKLAQRVLGRRIDEAPKEVLDLWRKVADDYVKRVAPSTDAAWLKAYKSVRSEFWEQVQKTASAKAWFTGNGFVFSGGPRSAPLFEGHLLVSGQRQEFRISLDHIAPKARFASRSLDPTNLQFVIQWDNWLLNELERVLPEFRR